MSGIFSFFWSFLRKFQRLTQENKKKGKKKIQKKENDKENTFQVLRLVILFIFIKYIITDKEKKRIRKKINK